jgi:hypothetical protein
MIIKQFLKDIIESNKFKTRIQKGTPVFVFQMGKVASSSIQYSINKYYNGYSVQAHKFSSDHHELNVRKLYQYYHSTSNQAIKIITLIREPISRNVSAFFENFKRETGKEFKQSNFTVNELKHLFLENFNHNVPLFWIDNNIKKYFKIDVYTEKFSDGGYQFYKLDNIELLLMKHDLADNTKEQLIKSYLNIKEFKLINKNIGNNKTYGFSYTAFKKNVKLPDDYLNKMRKSKYFNHFYSKEEIDDVISKWKEN